MSAATGLISSGLIGLPAHALAQAPSLTAQRVELTGDAAFATALSLFVRNGQYDQALTLLETRPDIVARDEGFRLRIQLLMALNRDDDALSALEHHLSAEPNDATARFQLGELHFRHHRDQSAALAFRLALSGNLEPFRVRIAKARLEAIAARRPWRFSGGLSLAPDTNVNGATDAREVQLFGLPFSLDDGARRRSGVVANFFASAEHTWHVSPRLAWRTNTQVSLSDAPGTSSDYATLTIMAGPEWRLAPTSTVSLLPTQDVRWFGGRLFETAAGLAAEGDFYAHNRQWRLGASWQSVHSRLSSDRDGNTASLSIARTRFLQASSLWRGGYLFVTRRARAATEGYGQHQLFAGRLFQAPFGTAAYLEVSSSYRRYAGVASAFGRRRIDTEGSLQVRVSKQDLSWAGAHPFLSLQASKARSTLSLFRYDRQRLEFGLTREF